jgi:hypothetical protein
VGLIFVSYRRDDTQSATGRLCDKLQEHFGADQVFHDIESIEPGDKFATTITSKVAASSIVLAMIGRHWLDATGTDGRPRLFDPADYVCLEIATALRHRIPVIPVLVEGAAIPPASSLPDSIADLAARQAHEITEQRWQYDSDLLIRQLELSVPPEGTLTEEHTSTRRQTLLQAVAGSPADFIQLLLHPRRSLAALLKQPNFETRAAVFFVISQLVAAWLFVLEGFVTSVPRFVLEGVAVGAFIVLVVMIPLHLSARAVRAPSYAPTTMVLLAYIESMVIVLAAAGVALLWTGMEIANTNFGRDVRAAFYADLPLEARVAHLTEIVDATIGGPFLALFALATGIWLFAAGWLWVASGAFRDLWRITRLRALSILILTVGALVIAGALVVIAGTL